VESGDFETLGGGDLENRNRTPRIPHSDHYVDHSGAFGMTVGL
jgi:hypothetical protein